MRQHGPATPGSDRGRMVEIKPGSRFRSTVCTTEVIAVKGLGEVDLSCGGSAMVDVGSAAQSGSLSADASDGTQLGKRYSDADETVELLCTKAGEGSLALGRDALIVKETKPLPASD